ncbi:hypothetical protein EB796_006907 [Bugula neritina]|uniref:Uncharacterized protein n=1 Tax=Bugula neritina TaxID=10212 RepID=A0A7J7K826_BUGNE|nr:hypothetical protein EB796_006907 [Bugula neritina]
MPKDTYQWHVLLWVPNLIGYLRLLICILGVLCHYQSAHVWFLLLFLTNFALDGIDGYLARQLGQCSTFGAWFDVFVDLIARGFLWVMVDNVSIYQRKVSHIVLVL